MDRPAAYEPQQPWLPSSEGIIDWGADFHDLMLGDRLRMDAFRSAVRETVQPGAVVVDLGTGTGILAEWALQAGAARVYGIDFNRSVLDVAIERIAAAGLGDGFVAVSGLSFDIALPERADVIVSETLGNLVDNEGCVRILADARTRFLKPGGVIMPSRAESYLVPVAAERASALLDAEAIRGGDESLSGAQRLRRLGVSGPYDTYYDTIIPTSCHLASPRLLRCYRWREEESDEYQVDLAFAVRHDGVFTGFKAFFIADLSDTVVLDISGDDIAGGTASDSWKHCYLPVRTPVPVRGGDRIALAFGRSSHASFAQRYRWTGRVLRNGGPTVRFDHSSGRVSGPTVPER